ncbi:MAG: diguanylate cyclase [Gemmataceae bacterium]
MKQELVRTAHETMEMHGEVDTLVTVPVQPPSPAQGDACLVHIYPTGPMMGRRYLLGEGTIVAGRDPECGLHLDDPSVSRRHAELRPGKTGHYVVDLQSTNGTAINDKPVSIHKLADGDTLRIGNWIFRYLTGGSIESQYHEEIYRLTIHDGLTGAANKRYFVEFLDRELSRSGRYRRPLSLILLDIDHFKKINDNHGHLCGDYVLRELAGMLKGSVRKEELFARYGGEELAFVLPETGRDGAVTLAERLRALVEGRAFQFDNNEFKVTVSMGVACTSGDPVVTSTELIRQADEKLYQAKNAGRNRVVA